MPGIFSTSFPNESAEILLCAGLVLFDDDYFKWTDEEATVRTTAFLTTMERVVGAKEGSFAEMSQVLSKL